MRATRSVVANTKLPSAPLCDFIRRQSKRFGGTQDGLVRDLAARLGQNAPAVDRKLDRIRFKGFVTVRVADEILTAYGYHVADVYGWEGYELGWSA